MAGFLRYLRLPVAVSQLRDERTNEVAQAEIMSLSPVPKVAQCKQTDDIGAQEGTNDREIDSLQPSGGSLQYGVSSQRSILSVYVASRGNFALVL